MRNFFSAKQDIYPLFRLAIPFALTGMVHSAIWFFETVFLARLGVQTLAAGSLVSWLFGTVSVILFGMLSSVNIIVAHKHGAKDDNGIALVARDGILLALLFSILAFILFRNMSPIFLLFGQSAQIVALATAYLHALSWGVFADFIMFACFEVLMGLGYARVILSFTIIFVSLNIVSSYGFIFGRLGLPALGIAGAGAGMAVSYSITAIALIIYIVCVKNYRNYFRYTFKLHKPVFLKELFQIGLPMGVMYCLEVSFFFALTLFMGLLGSRWQAANQVALQYLGLLMSIMFSIAQAITVRMGHLIGSGQAQSAEKAAYVGILIACGLASLVATVYWIFPGILISVDFDIHNPRNYEVVNDITKILAVSAIFQIVEATRIAYFGSLRGIKDTKFTVLTSILSFWVIAIPLGYCLATYVNMGSTGYWCGMILGTGLSVFLLQWRFRIKMHRYRRQPG